MGMRGGVGGSDSLSRLTSQADCFKQTAWVGLVATIATHRQVPEVEAAQPITRKISFKLGKSEEVVNQRQWVSTLSKNFWIKPQGWTQAEEDKATALRQSNRGSHLLMASSSSNAPSHLPFPSFIRALSHLVVISTNKSIDCCFFLKNISPKGV